MISAAPAANRTALAAADAFPAGDPLPAQRGADVRQPALEKLILSRRPTQLAYSRRLLRTGSPACAPKPRLDDFLRIAPKNR